ncbi:SH3 domain-containing protein [Stachybotrys elegans]|uniref:SH3 domain-containing protein n=1 Tax=Stachybotrys elegans TaxID=80388 RepID=A0A8K0SJS1_9HYPO|nr:SH3 domain-containing protein [Stachybotrys elegans]
MVNADRQLIMETNRSLRNIKTELENLLEKGVIDESVFDTISATLPEESPLSGPLRTTANRGAASVRNTPSQNAQPTEPPVQAMQNLDIKQPQAASPPSYEHIPPPGLPARSSKPIIAHARALYRYAGADARDVHLEKDDRIAVYEYMNNDWWMGRNERTGQEGIFPRNYVFVEQQPQQKGPAPYGQPQYGYPYQQQGPPQGPPPQQNPYNTAVPPVAVAEGQHQQGEQQGDSKVAQYGKKFGSKLGNAAIFGAGATMGSNLVNSIF